LNFLQEQHCGNFTLMNLKPQDLQYTQTLKYRNPVGMQELDIDGDHHLYPAQGSLQQKV
jgi:hypothetical protein